MRIRLAPQARADLDSIWLYVARESGSHAIATRTIGSVTDKFGLFAKFPYIGKNLEADLRPNVRAFPVNNYVIFYSVKPEEIRILRIIHASRDAQVVFAEE
jgi:plasmid stabilization system protein ParE